MADDLLIAELMKRVPELQAQVDRRLNPDMAGDMPPATMRAASAMRKAYPADMANVKVKEMSFNDPYAFTNTLAYTPSPVNNLVNKILKKPMVDTESIEVNPGSDMMEGQSSLNEILAHELQHVRQHRTMPAQDMLSQFKNTPYQERPIEIEARQAATDYTKSHPSQYDRPRYMSLILDSLRKMHIPGK